MGLIWLNRLLNLVATAGASAAGALAAGLVPEKWKAVAAALAALGTLAAKVSKTPSQAMAAAVPSSAPPPPQPPSPPPAARPA